MSFIIDAHAHIYPEKIALKASKTIGKFYDISMSYDGSVNHLLELGEKYNIDRFLVHSVATTPEQVNSINNFIAGSVNENPDTFIGFATLHPDMLDIRGEIERVKNLGLKGIKLHPDFQKFNIDDPCAYKIYEVLEDNLPILMHTGDSRHLYSDPKRVLKVIEDFPKLKIICAHFGGWSQWNEAERYLVDKNIWVDTSSSMYALSAEKAKSLIHKFGEDRVIFGSDYPMWDPGEEIGNIEKLHLPYKAKEKIFYKNICDLLDIKY